MYVQQVQQPGFVTQQTVVTKTKGDSMRSAIPDLPCFVAVLLCIINFFFPGIGTILAGFSVLCCGNPGQDASGRFGSFCINFWVGILQLLLTFIFVGWVWSIVWGYAFITQSGSTGEDTTVTTQHIAQPIMQVAPVMTVQQPVLAVQQPVVAVQQQAQIFGVQSF